MEGDWGRTAGNRTRLWPGASRRWAMAVPGRRGRTAHPPPPPPGPTTRAGDLSGKRPSPTRPRQRQPRRLLAAAVPGDPHGHGGAASELFRAAGPGTATPWPGSGLPVAAMRARLHSNKAPFAPGDAPARITWRGRVLKGPAGKKDAGGGGAAGPVPSGRPALPRWAPAVPNRVAWRGPRGGGRRRRRRQEDGVRPSAVGPAGRGCPGLRGR